MPVVHEHGQLAELVQGLPILFPVLHDHADFPFPRLEVGQGAARQGPVHGHGDRLTREAALQRAFAVHRHANLVVPALQGVVHVGQEGNLLESLLDLWNQELENVQIISDQVHLDPGTPHAGRPELGPGQLVRDAGPDR